MSYGERTSVEIERIATAIVDSAYKVHTTLGPGLLESVYVQCLAHELKLRGFTVWREVPVPIVYEGLKLESGFRIDLLVNGIVVIEAKSIQDMHPVFPAQLRTHLKLADKRLGFLINFNVPYIKDGIRRIAD
jgi:GxxExxY protein